MAERDIARLRDLVLSTVRRTVNRFMEEPHVFFTETDLHAYFYHRLFRNRLQVRTGDGVTTVLVHKEYPTSFRYSKKTMEDYGFGKKGRRGNYDVVLLNPQFVRESDVKSVVNKDVRDTMSRREKDPEKFRKELIAAIEFKYVINNSREFIGLVEKDAVKLSHGQRYQDFEAHNLVFCNLMYRYVEELEEKVKTFKTEYPVKSLLAVSYFDKGKKVTLKPITNGWKL